MCQACRSAYSRRHQDFRIYRESAEIRPGDTIRLSALHNTAQQMYDIQHMRNLHQPHYEGTRRHHPILLLEVALHNNDHISHIGMPIHQARKPDENPPASVFKKRIKKYLMWWTIRLSILIKLKNVHPMIISKYEPFFVKD